MISENNIGDTFSFLTNFGCERPYRPGAFTTNSLEKLKLVGVANKALLANEHGKVRQSISIALASKKHKQRREGLT